MNLKNILFYENKYAFGVNNENDSLFYLFDYDTRSADINMEFQHFHTFFELFIPLCPNAIHFIEGIPYEVQAYDIVGISPNKLHKTQYPSSKPCKRLIIQFKMPEHINGISNEYEQLLGIFCQKVPIFRFDSELQRQLYGKLNDIYRLAVEKDPLQNLLIHQKFLEFVILLYQNQSSNIYANETMMSELEQKIYSVAGYIHGHCAQNLMLDKLASTHGLSSSYLSHRFKEITGFSVTDYIQMARVRNVQSLLINTNMPIAEIPERCGFNSFSQFNRVFRKYVGASPSKYRQQHQDRLARIAQA